MQLTRKVAGDDMLLMDGENVVLTMKEVQEENALRILFEGSLRSETIHNIWDELNALASFGLDLILDMKAVTYVSAAFEDALIKTQQIMENKGKGSLSIVSVPKEIYKEWNKNGITQVLMIEE